MFSAALGLIGGIGSIIAGGQQYALGMQELQLKREALDQQKDFGMLQYGLSLDQLRKEQEQEDYIRAQNEENKVAQALERAKIEGQRRQTLAAYQQEREYVVNRQVEIDRAQAEKYALELEAYLRNTDIATEERDLALQYLDEAKAVASGERDEDLQRLRLERLTAQQERDFAIAEMQNSQAIAAGERADDIAYRDQIIGQLSQMTGQMESAYRRMGEIEAPRQFTEDEIINTIGQYEDNAIANVDRAADRVASIAEASLMDGGIANSSVANRRRGEVAGQLAQEYDNARLSARNQAMDYIQGRDALAGAGFEREMAARGSTFSEIANLYSPMIQGLTQNRQTLSANDFQAPVAVGSGNILRGVSSANSYAAPLQVGTAANDPRAVSSSMGQTLNTPSVAEAYQITGDYNQFQPQMWNLTSPSGFASNASSLVQTAGHYDPLSYMKMAQQTSGAGFAAIGGALNDFNRSGGFGQFGGGQAASGQNWPIPQSRPTTTTQWPIPQSRPYGY